MQAVKTSATQRDMLAQYGYAILEKNCAC